MKRFFLLIAFALLSMSAFADTYRILKLSPSPIVIEGVSKKVQDTFTDQQEIKWQYDTQGMWVADLTNGGYRYFSKEAFDQKNVKNVYSYLKTNHPSTRGGYRWMSFQRAAYDNGKRLALVIGNSNYSYEISLRNPIADASEIANRLRRLGFDVMVMYDASKDEMDYALGYFRDAAYDRKYGTVLFYYAGHGLQYSDKPFLIPTDAKIFTGEHVLKNCISGGEIVSYMNETLAETKIAIFDACRSEKTFLRGARADFKMDGLENGLIIFSTKGGYPASDGDSDHSPFAEALLNHMGTPNIGATEVMERVISDVKKSTKDFIEPQVPNMTHFSLDHSFYFSKEAAPLVKPSTSEKPEESLRGKEEPVKLSGTHDGHEWVDLGLPSGLRWASCNVGAHSPSDYGSYFAWGECSPKSKYSYDTYTWCNGSRNSLTKYNFRPENGEIDNRTQLELSDDAARQNWGGAWRMPTHEEFEELVANCTTERISLNGHYGLKFTSIKNGLSIFLPSGGYREKRNLVRADNDGIYWSSSLGNFPCDAWYLYNNHIGSFGRHEGRTVRPVLDKETSTEQGYLAANDAGDGNVPQWPYSASGNPSSIPYLTFTSCGSSSISLKKYNQPHAVHLEFKKGAEPWKHYSVGTEIVLKDGESVSFRAEKGGNTTMARETSSNYHYHYFCNSGQGTIMASGSIMSLLDRTCQLRSIKEPLCFFALFSGFKSLKSAPSLDATELSSRCYESMFSNCTGLIKAPELPAPELAFACYMFMFSGCSSLIETPHLPAERLSRFCYARMFDHCTSLVRAPELPAKELESDCYGHMFYGCTNLIYPPETLPATTGRYACYDSMFSGCTSLAQKPKIMLSYSIDDYGEKTMFDGCIRLNP